MRSAVLGVLTKTEGRFDAQASGCILGARSRVVGLTGSLPVSDNGWKTAISSIIGVNGFLHHDKFR